MITTTKMMRKEEEYNFQKPLVNVKPARKKRGYVPKQRKKILKKVVVEKPVAFTTPPPNYSIVEAIDHIGRPITWIDTPKKSVEKSYNTLKDQLGIKGSGFENSVEIETRKLQGILKKDFDKKEKVIDNFGEFSEIEPKPGSGVRIGSRMAIPMAQASGVSFADDLMPPNNTTSPKGMRGGAPRRSLSPIHLPHSATPRSSNDFLDRPDYRRSNSVDRIMEGGGKLQPTPPPAPAPPKPPTSSCGHKDAGQELCYLCHQRDRRNIPVSFTEERKKREKEEDRLLQQYQHMKDTESMLQEQDVMHIKRHENQKMAAFNLGVSEAVNQKKTTRPLDFHPSYIFQKRPLTPPRFIKQEMYHSDLAQQVVSKDEAHKKRRADEEFLERLEQVQLAEDLAAQREQYLKEKSEQQEQYKRALSAQITVRDSIRKQQNRPQIRQSRRLGPLTLPHPQIIVPFMQVQTVGVQEGPQNLKRTVRFKPLQLPARVPDSSDPVFGKFDMTNESMAERRRRAHDLYKEQLGTVEQRKRDAILRRLGEQKEEEDMLHRTKNELLEDRANRYERMHFTRKRLEDDWFKSRDLKKAKEQEEKERSKSPGALLHEQCDKYDRCGQCKRRVGNCGESNIWRESRYIPGSRLMV